MTVSPATQGASGQSSGREGMAEDQLSLRELRTTTLVWEFGLPVPEFYDIQFSGERQPSFRTHHHKHSNTRRGKESNLSTKTLCSSNPTRYKSLCRSQPSQKNQASLTKSAKQ